MQKQRVVSWLSQHNFPQGMIFFSDGLVHDPLRQKTIFLRNLMQEVLERSLYSWNLFLEDVIDWTVNPIGHYKVFLPFLLSFLTFQRIGNAK